MKIHPSIKVLAVALLGAAIALGVACDETTKIVQQEDATPQGVLSVSAPDGFRPNRDISFTASVQNPGGAAITTYEFDFDDGNTLTTDQATVTHQYAAPGTFNPTVVATDAEGNASDPLVVTQFNDGVVEIMGLGTPDITAAVEAVPPGSTEGPVVFRVTASDADDELDRIEINYGDGAMETLSSLGTPAGEQYVDVVTHDYIFGSFTPTFTVFTVDNRSAMATQSLNLNALAPTSPTNVALSSRTTTTLNVTWTDNSNNEDLFRIVVRNAGNSVIQDFNVGANTTSTNITGLTEDSTFTVNVTAFRQTAESAPTSNTFTTLVSFAVIFADNDAFNTPGCAGGACHGEADPAPSTGFNYLNNATAQSACEELAARPVFTSCGSQFCFLARASCEPAGSHSGCLNDASRFDAFWDHSPPTSLYLKMERFIQQYIDGENTCSM